MRAECCSSLLWLYVHRTVIITEYAVVMRRYKNNPPGDLIPESKWPNWNPLVMLRELRKTKNEQRAEKRLKDLKRHSGEALMKRQKMRARAHAALAAEAEKLAAEAEKDSKKDSSRLARPARFFSFSSEAKSVSQPGDCRPSSRKK